MPNTMSSAARGIGVPCRVYAANHHALSRLHICGDTSELMPLFAGVPCGIFDLDTLTPVSRAHVAHDPGRMLSENIGTAAVFPDGTPGNMCREIKDCRRMAGSRGMAGAGCEIPGDSPESNVPAMGFFAREHGP